MTGTAEQVVTAPGQPGTVEGVVQAFYSSSSGGRTENKEEVWSGQRYPYLVSVDDHWAHLPRTRRPPRTARSLARDDDTARVGPSGDTILNTDLAIGAASGSLTSQVEEWGLLGPLSTGGSPVLLKLTVPDARLVRDRMVAPGPSRSWRSRTGRTVGARVASVIRSGTCGS